MLCRLQHPLKDAFTLSEADALNLFRGTPKDPGKLNMGQLAAPKWTPVSA